MNLNKGSYQLSSYSFSDNKIKYIQLYYELIKVILPIRVLSLLLKFVECCIFY